MRGPFRPLVVTMGFCVLTELWGRARCSVSGRVFPGVVLSRGINPFLIARRPSSDWLWQCVFWGQQLQFAFLIMGPVSFSGSFLDAKHCKVFLYTSTHCRAWFRSAVKFLVPSGLAFRVCWAGLSQCLTCGLCPHQGGSRERPAQRLLVCRLSPWLWPGWWA